MRYLSIFLVVFVLLFNCAYAFSVDNVKLGDLYNKSICEQRFGSVIDENKEDGENNVIFEHIFITYKIKNNQKIISGIILATPKYTTSTGLKVGDPESKITQIYGTPFSKSEEEGCMVYIYTGVKDAPEDAIFIVTAQKGKVLTISIMDEEQ